MTQDLRILTYPDVTSGSQQCPSTRIAEEVFFPSATYPDVPGTFNSTKKKITVDAETHIEIWSDRHQRRNREQRVSECAFQYESNATEISFLSYREKANSGCVGFVLKSTFRNTLFPISALMTVRP
eukprot:sb/3475534/